MAHPESSALDHDEDGRRDEHVNGPPNFDALTSNAMHLEPIQMPAEQ